jgi:hypothetical protein
MQQFILNNINYKRIFQSSCIKIINIEQYKL